MKFDKFLFRRCILSFSFLLSLYGTSTLSNFPGFDLCSGSTECFEIVSSLFIYHIVLILVDWVWSNRLLDISVPNADVPVIPRFSNS